MRAATRWTTSLALLLAPLGAQAQSPTERSSQEQSIEQQNLQTAPAPQPFSITVAGQYTTRQVETAGAAPSLDLGYSVTPNLYLQPALCLRPGQRRQDEFRTGRH